MTFKIWKGTKIILASPDFQEGKEMRTMNDHEYTEKDIVVDPNCRHGVKWDVIKEKKNFTETAAERYGKSGHYGFKTDPWHVIFVKVYDIAISED